METADLSSNEQDALLLLHRKRGLLVSDIPSRNERDGYGQVSPGRGVYGKLEKKGLCFETQEDIGADGFQFTPMMELTEEGRQVVSKLLAPATASSPRRPR